MNLSISPGWTAKRIGELCDIGRGSSPRPIVDQRYFENGTIPWIKIADATASGKYLYETKQYVNEYGASFSKRLPAGSLIVAASGTLGYTQLLGIEGCVHDGWMYLINLKGIDKDFLYYTLQWMKQHFYNSAYGAAIQNVNTTILRDTVIPYPPLPIQRKIGEILSAYDDLIENNTRRIKMLEEMAQMIYREWFVKFRFPGHEKVKMVDVPVETLHATSLQKMPEGWEVGKLQDFVELCYGKALKSEDRKEGPYPVYGSSGVVGYHSESFVDGTGIIVGRKGNVGSVHWTDKPFYPIDTVYYVKTNISLYYTFFNLQQQNFINNDAAVPGLNRNQAYALPFLMPAKKQMEAFDEVCIPVFSTLRNLRSKNQNLRQTRDLLLPKLISGEVDVEGFDININVET